MRHVRNFARANRYIIFRRSYAFKALARGTGTRITRVAKVQRRNANVNRATRIVWNVGIGGNLHVARGKRFGIRCWADKEMEMGECSWVCNRRTTECIVRGDCILAGRIHTSWLHRIKNSGMRELEAMIMIPSELHEIILDLRILCLLRCFIKYYSNTVFNFYSIFLYNYPEFELGKNSVEENLKFFHSFYEFSIEKLWIDYYFIKKYIYNISGEFWKEKSTYISVNILKITFVF